MEKDEHTIECSHCNHVFQPLSHESTRVIRVGFNEKRQFRKYYQATCPVCQETVEFDMGAGGEAPQRNCSAVLDLEMAEVENGVYKWFVDEIQELLKICNKRGYKKAWIYHRIVEKEQKTGLKLGTAPIKQTTKLKKLRLKEWEYLAKILGYKKGWAWHRHAEIQNIIKLAEDKVKKIALNW